MDSSLNIPPQVRAAELTSLLNHHSIKVLSLDCFDTLLWRNTATPIDVFYDLQNRSTFKTMGFNARLRRYAEKIARENIQLCSDDTEVKLEDIYQASFASLSQEQLHQLAEEELAAEIETCCAFQPIIDLMRKAHAQKIKIIIVSDTYFNEKQLRHLLEKKLPADVMTYISKIFCSSEYGKSKTSGLFKRVLEQFPVAPRAILHIGDNQVADVHAARAYQINAVRLLHHENDVAEVLRMQTLAASFIDPKIRNIRSLPSPFRRLLATDTVLQGQPENTIGYVSAGPILYAFGRYICNEVEQLQKQGKRLKVLFLMRDAYLPSLVCAAIAGKEIGYRVRISRFASYAASFCSTHDIDAYLGSRVESQQFKEMCKQLLLSDEMTASILNKLKTAKYPANEFSKYIHQNNIQEIIFKESAAYRARLISHLQKECGIEKGDTLMFVDLGYTGTAQLKLQPIFKAEMDIDVIGRYLISLPAPSLTNSRRGLLDTENYDDNTLMMLVTYIALLEQICTSHEKSVIDYDVDGNAIYSETTVSDTQHDKLAVLQAECLRFARDMQQQDTQFSDEMLRDAAAINLCRLLFLPVKSEINYLASFQFDFNMGSNQLNSIIDSDLGLAGLRRRGWLHCSKESPKTMRTNYPAEWRAASLELSVMLMAQHRYKLEFALNDLSHRRELLEILVLQGQTPVTLKLEAMPTHDGYFSLSIPIVSANTQIAICFGQKYQWVELESAGLIKLETLYSRMESENTQDASPLLSVNAMVHKQGGLFECTSEQGMLIFNPANKIGEAKSILRMIFRPIVRIME